MKKVLILLIVFSSLKATSQNNSDSIHNHFYLEAGTIFGANNELRNPLEGKNLDGSYFYYEIIGYSFIKRLSFEIGFNSYNSSYDFGYKSYNMNYSYININRIIPAIKYNIPASGNSFYLKAGVSLGVNSKMNIENKLVSIYPNKDTINNSFNINGVKGISLGYEIGFGLDVKIYKPFSFTVGCLYIHNHLNPLTLDSPNIPISSLTPISFSSFGFNAGLIYTFGRK